MNKQESTKKTALSFSACYGHDKCVESLIQAGPDVIKVIKDGETALIQTAKNIHEKCVENQELM